jgi:hypothetical protein
MRTQNACLLLFRLLVFFGVCFGGFCQSAADGPEAELLRRVEIQLKELGFYFGPLDGKETPVLAGAIRRYQIRQGLEVTGKLNAQTVEALGLGEKGTPELKPANEGVQGSEETKAGQPVFGGERSVGEPTVRLRRGGEDGTGNAGPGSKRTYPVSDPREEYGRMLAGTPYARAPMEVQALVVHRAQEILSHRGLYRGRRTCCDWLPGFEDTPAHGDASRNACGACVSQGGVEGCI